MAPISENVQRVNEKIRPVAQRVIQAHDEGTFRRYNAHLKRDVEAVNDACQWLCHWVETEVTRVLTQKKKSVLLGGEHSVSLGSLKAHAKQIGALGVLQIDAHMDLRKAYQGFVHSHASVMYEAMRLNEITQLVQVGIRDCCEA